MNLNNSEEIIEYSISMNFNLIPAREGEGQWFLYNCVYSFHDSYAWNFIKLCGLVSHIGSILLQPLQDSMGLTQTLLAHLSRAQPLTPTGMI